MTKSKITRREFIKISAVASGVLVGGSVVQAALWAKIKTVEESRLLMGTIINLTLVSNDEKQAKLAIEQTFSQRWNNWWASLITANLIAL